MEVWEIANKVLAVRAEIEKIPEAGTYPGADNRVLDLKKQVMVLADCLAALCDKVELKRDV